MNDGLSKNPTAKLDSDAQVTVCGRRNAGKILSALPRFELTSGERIICNISARDRKLLPRHRVRGLRTALLARQRLRHRSLVTYVSRPPQPRFVKDFGRNIPWAETDSVAPIVRDIDLRTVGSRSYSVYGQKPYLTTAFVLAESRYWENVQK